MCDPEVRFFLKNEFLVRDRPPIPPVQQMQTFVPHLPDPSLGGSISHQKFIFEEKH